MGVTTTLISKPFNPRGNDQSPLAYNKAAIYSGKALSFDGVNDSIDISNFSLNGYTAFSICFHKTDEFNNAMIFSSADSISDGVNIYQVSPGHFRARLNGFNTDTDLEVSTKKGFFVLTYDGSNFNWYYQAQNIGSSTTNQTFAITNTTSTIGRQSFASAQYLNGQMAGVKIFNTALTAAQIADLYNNPEKIVPTGVANTALKLWLPMQEGAGTTAYDGSGNGNHGTISGATYVNGVGAPVAQTAVIDWNKGTNYVKHSENIVTGWTLQNVAASINSLEAPDGLTTATKFTASAVDIFHLNNFTYASASAGIWKESVFAKAGEVDFAYLVIRVNNGSDRYGVKFDLTDGTFVDDITTGSPTNTGYEITDAGNGWYKCTIQALHTSGNITNVLGPNIAGNLVDINGNHQGDGVSGMYMWGASLQPSTAGDSYIRTGATAQTSPVLLPQGLTTGRDITGVNLFENVRKQGALNLDGNSWAEVHDNGSFNLINLSLECWFYADSNTTSDGLLGQWAASQGFLLYVVSSSDVRFFINGVARIYSTALTGWNHIVGVYDGATMKLYINGVEEVSGAHTTNPGSVNAPIEIGRFRETSSTQYPNQIAQPRIYNRALTAEEVQRNFDASKNTYTN